MEWLPADLLEAEGNIGLLHDQLTHTLACRHCNNCICLQSPGNLVILFLFMVWQIRRWWQLGRHQLQPWCSGDMKMQYKGLQLLYNLPFLSCLWKQKSEEEEEDEEEKKEEESFPLAPLKSYSPSKGRLVGNQDTTAPPQPSGSSEGLPKAIEKPEQVLTQPSSPFRCFPTFQILNNLPVRNKIASGSSLQQRKGQFFWGLPCLHSESLETTFLSLDGPSPRKLSVCPVFFNKVAFLPVYNLLLPYYYSPTHYPKPEAYTVEDLIGMAPSSQLVPPPSAPPIPSLTFHLKPLPVSCKEVLSDAEAHTRWLTQQIQVPWVSKSQALNSQPELQRIRPSTFLHSSENLRGMPGNSNLHQHNPESPSVFLLYPSSPQGVLTRIEVPWMTMKQNEHLKASESVIPTACPSPPSLLECQRVNPIGHLSGLKALWETTVQKETPQIAEPRILTPCQSIVSMKKPQGTVPTGIPSGNEAQWGTIVHKENTQAFEPLMPASCQPSGSLSELQNVNPKGRLSASKDFWGNLGYRENLQVAESPMSAPCPPLDSLSEFQKQSPLENLSRFPPQGQCRENSGNLWAFKTPNLNFNTGLYATIPACVPSGSETQWKSRPIRENRQVSANLVSAPSPLSASLLDSIMCPQGVSLESKALWETKGQRENLSVSDSPDPIQRTGLVPFIRPQRLNTEDGFPRSETIQKNTEHSKNYWIAESPILVLKPSPALVLEPPRASSMVDPFNSKTCHKDIQRRKKPLASNLPAHSLTQHQLGVRPSGVPSDFMPIEGYMKQKENCCVSGSPVWVPNPLPNSVSKSHLTEASGGQCSCKPMGDAGEQRIASWATELPAPSSLTVSSKEPHIDFELVCRNIQERETSQSPYPPVVNPPHLTSWSPILAKALEFDPIQSGLQKEEMSSEAKAETPSSQGGAVPEVVKDPEIQAWQWSKELKLRLKKLRQSPAFKSPDPSHLLCSSPAPNSPTPDSWGLSSCPPHQIHPLSLPSYSSSYHPKRVQKPVRQSAQASHCSHSPPKPQLLASGRAEQESQEKERMKTVTQIPSPGCVHVKAGEKYSGMGELSNTGVLISGKKQAKTLALLSEQKKVSPRKPKAAECGGRTARLDLCTGTGNSHPARAWRPAEARVGKFSKRSQYRGQNSPYTVLPQQLLSKAAGPQDRRRVGLVVGDMQNPRHHKRCPWAHMRKHFPSSTRQTTITRCFQRLTKFLDTSGPLPTKSSQ